ncbi:PREDICTED: pectate lyase-like [Fragaria vesca subsp. vesca]|uniref:pectate lyase-like n=1 Tax=Fragaria vesca subsp. vesca TaxID=101020 RepID=UPI0002C3447D|nr:PREDICTED: pectate lyase-like [Fragaria vesca subsp. vesca]
MVSMKFSLVLFMCSFCVILPCLKAGADSDDGTIAVFDPVLQEREKRAEIAALKAYQPDPESVTDELIKDVETSIERSNTTRRHLAKKIKAECTATNPIDRCWRCNPDWAKNRKQLANCVLGFGRRTRGGKRGPIYVVHDSSDNDMANPKPGTLRHAVIQTGPLWIIFKHSMTIKLNKELIMTSHKTIDGRGANVHIAHGAGITIQFVENVIIHGIHIHDIVSVGGGLIRDSLDHIGLRGQSDGDGITVFGSSHIWLDHLSMWNCYDGLTDVVQGSTAITISNCHFTRHNDVMLFGANDLYERDQIMQITVAFNHFGKGLIQRMPRCRFGFFHVVNNDYTHWQMYAIGGSSHPTIISQGNRYVAPPDPKLKEITSRAYSTPEAVWKTWQWRSEGDLMENGAYFRESGEPRKGRGHFSRFDVINAKPGSFVRRLTRFAGTLGCRVGKAC